MSENILEIRHLGKSFGTHEVLRDIDFNVKKGDVISIIGASGSGKSTLLRCVNLLETPSSGEILYHGKNVVGRGVNAPEYRSHVGKYGMRNAMEIATTGCSVNVRLSADKKTFDRVRIGYGVAGPVPMRAPSAEAFLTGKPVTMENIEACAKTVLEDINPRDSWRASKAFRRHIAVEMCRRGLIESVKRCGGEI